MSWSKFSPPVANCGNASVSLPSRSLKPKLNHASYSECPLRARATSIQHGGSGASFWGFEGFILGVWADSGPQVRLGRLFVRIPGIFRSRDGSKLSETAIIYSLHKNKNSLLKVLIPWFFRINNDASFLVSFLMFDSFCYLVYFHPCCLKSNFLEQ